MARRLATGIGLDLRQRNALLASAGYVADYPETPLSSPDLAYVRAALQIIIDGHGVIPAIAVQHPGIGIAANDAMGLLIDGIAGHLLEPPSTFIASPCTRTEWLGGSTTFLRGPLTSSAQPTSEPVGTGIHSCSSLPTNFALTCRLRPGPTCWRERLRQWFCGPATAEPS